MRDLIFLWSVSARNVVVDDDAMLSRPRHIIFCGSPNVTAAMTMRRRRMVTQCGGEQLLTLACFTMLCFLPRRCECSF